MSFNKIQTNQIRQWIRSLSRKEIRSIFYLVKEEYSKINPGMKRKSKEQAIAYAALENAWFNHETDTFPAPLKDYDGKPYSNDQN